MITSILATLAILFLVACDSGAETFEEFSRNLAKASQALKETNIRVIDHLTNAV